MQTRLDGWISYHPAVKWWNSIQYNYCSVSSTLTTWEVPVHQNQRTSVGASYASLSGIQAGKMPRLSMRVSDHAFLKIFPSLVCDTGWVLSFMSLSPFLLYKNSCVIWGPEGVESCRRLFCVFNMRQKCVCPPQVLNVKNHLLEIMCVGLSILKGM